MWVGGWESLVELWLWLWFGGVVWLLVFLRLCWCTTTTRLYYQRIDFGISLSLSRKVVAAPRLSLSAPASNNNNQVHNGSRQRSVVQQNPKKGLYF